MVSSPGSQAERPTAPGAKRRPRVLFVGEAVTLAHVARPVALLQALDPGEFELCFACDARYDHLLPPELPATRRTITTIPGRQFLDALARGRPLYDAATLRSYVQEDLRLLEDVRPDLVVGDFRLSLAVSAPLTGVPYATITNVYWSPYAVQSFPVPDLPLTRVVGPAVAQPLFGLVRPVAFASHTLPMRRIRKEFGLPPLGFSLQRVYTHADYTLYADISGLIETQALPPNHSYLGPIDWSPAVPLPNWWSELPTDRPVVYVTLGSSGRPGVLSIVLQALADLPVSVLAATAGERIDPVPANARMAEYLPGREAAERSALVICNGGSMTTQQSLAAGVPVIGIAGNLDQHLNMQALERTGVGERLHASRVSAEEVRRTAERILNRSEYREAAAGMRRRLKDSDASARFRRFAEELLLGLRV